ncbi:MAG: hypothetical protein KAR38_01560, partial [Calditrichia bacterium]|nr:hypothetical protein [Calditrichia bacterium]
PMVYEFSYFNVFDIKAYNQVRSSLGYNWKSYLLQLNHIITTFEDENSHEMVFLISKRRNSLGIIYNNGFTGNNFGVYGQILYPLWKNLSLRLYGNYYNYERYMIDISEHATAFSAGIQYRMGNSYIRAEIQEAGNNLMKNDWRGFFQYIYSFNL